MDIDFSEQILGEDDKPMKEMVDGKERPLTFGILAARALLLDLKSDQGKTDVDSKLVRWDLAKRLRVGGSVALAVPEVALLVTRLGECYGPLVVGQMVSVLDPERVARANANALK